MNSRKFFSISLAVMMLLSLFFGSVSRLQNVTAAPTSPVDEANVPHYFGPYPNWANSPFTMPAAEVIIAGDGAGATAEASVGANGAITGITVTNTGSGYSAATVTIGGSGSGAQASASVTASGIVTGVTVSAAGAGYIQPVVTFSGGGGSGVLTQVGNQLVPRQFATDFATPPGVLGPVFVVVPVTMPANGQVTEILYYNQATPGGSPTPSAGNLFHAYVLHATGVPNEYAVLWDSGELVVPVAVDPVGEIVPIAVPNIPVTTGDTIAFYGEGIPVDDLGTGADILSYPSLAAPVVEGLVALGSAEFPIFSQARTYSFAASVIDNSAVLPLTDATASAFGGVDALVLAAGGSGYTFPTIDFDMPDDPNGVQAKAHVAAIALGDPVDGLDPVTGAITAIVLDEAGSGYSAAPNVVIRDGTLFDPINNGGSGAAATASLLIQTVVVDTFGSGYISAPSVFIDDLAGFGSGAAADAFVNAGGVTAIVVDNPGSGYITAGGIKKFVDSLPGLCNPAGVAGDAIPPCPNYLVDPTSKYIPLAVPDTSGPYQAVPDVSQTYEIGLVQYRMSFGSGLPPSLVRGYVQLETAANAAISQHFPLVNEMLDGTSQPIFMSDGVTQYLAVTPPQYLGPAIVTPKDQAVRIVFRNLLPTGDGGDIFLPVDSTIMGSGMGQMMDPYDPVPAAGGDVMDMVRNPMCTDAKSMGDMCFLKNRATLHLHGGNSPWISDGTPHQWITPAGDTTMWPEGVSVENVPDMNVCGPADDGCQTFYYTNQQSARLMFYHDHSWGITRLNVYAGEAAAYLITDDTEQALMAPGGALETVGLGIPLVIQDKTFVPQPEQLAWQDPTWNSARWGGYGNLWYHHVYMPAQNPGDPGGMSAFGRWMYGPWFWPPAGDAKYGPIANPYYNMDPATNFTTPLAVPCNLDDPATWQYQEDPFCEPPLIPGTPNISAGMEQFNDTPLVNGTVYPTLTLEPKSYRLRILNAANDRFFNLQWYVGDASTASTSLNSLGEVIGATEVALNAAEVAAAQIDPVVFPTPDLARSPAGPDWIQIGTEGGFLPAPVVIDGQQVTTWINDPTRFDVGNVDLHSLLVAPAERADVVVDFSKFAGKTLILYNDAPAAFPARIPSYDYYTGAPDLSPVGAPTILPGYGPNTRTIMQIKIAAAPAAPPFPLASLRAAFRHHADGSGVFESGQHPIIVGQATYNSAYGTSFVSGGWCNSPTNPSARCDGFARINEQGGDMFKFDTLRGTQVSVKLEPKAIHDETNASSFDEFGRMQANLGVEVSPATPGLQNVVLHPFTFPTTEIIDASGLPAADVKVTPISSGSDGTQIWKITHNGVDTHPIHFHAYDVQLLNRVTWDNIIIPPDLNELGWKDTVRIAPLEDTIVALRAVIPVIPFDLPNSLRLLSPMQPEGAPLALSSLADALGLGMTAFAPNGDPIDVYNHYINFGAEYVYHCHILSHEEMDMMRPVSLAFTPKTPTGLAAQIIAVQGSNGTLRLSWMDNSLNDTSFKIQRMEVGSGVWVDLATVTMLLDPNQPDPLLSGSYLGQRFFDDVTYRTNRDYQYRVIALNTVGDTWDYANPALNEIVSGGFPTVTNEAASDPIPSPPPAPSNLTAAVQAGPQVRLTWRDNAVTETSFVVERSAAGGAFAEIGTVPAFAGSGPGVTFVDTLAGQPLDVSYSYRVKAVNAGGSSMYSNVATLLVPSVPLAPTNLVASPFLQGNNARVTLTWTDNAFNESAYRIWRSTDPTFATGVTITNLAANSTSFTTGNIARGTLWYFRVTALNVSGFGSAETSVTTP